MGVSPVAGYSRIDCIKRKETSMVRDLKPEDREIVLAMVDAFYNSPGVLHSIPVSNFADAYDEMCNGGSSRLRGLLIEYEGKPAGFCSLSFSYSTEAGGPVVLMEEAFILPQFRSHGLGSSIFEFVKKEYKGKAARLRLEVVEENTRAIALYQRMGFQRLPYVQMILEDFD